MSVSDTTSVLAFPLMMCDLCASEPQGAAWVQILLPNPWKVRENMCLMNYVPLVVYSDNTPGNFSKKWNKHMSFYLILARLPPKPGTLGTLGFNVKFLSSSNSASALGMADRIVDELK